ncbi:DUF4350 domain-containing protein [Fulvivirga maritima]|uniref:DUF4350 domain-containing protein n=1 Tax=Fulvivirga maritima TaxID=2904247 RepID=UPI001F18DF71|nr:DUF4350 domain-containing protein [Fulvivirga maritima]UII26148.1 DUF4350 domain-containing protein [Fulvivirga maritima]
MNRNSFLIIIGAVLIVVFVFFYFTNDRKKHFNWSENYKVESQQPYGTYIYHELLKRTYGNNFRVLNNPLRDSITSENKDALYMLVGQGSYYTSEDVDSLLAFVNAGNEVFISTSSFPFDLANMLIDEDCGSKRYYTDSKINMSLTDNESQFAYEYIQDQELFDYYWMYMDSIECSGGKVLGYLNGDKPNFLEIEHGSGKIYFYTSPLVFTNLYLKREELLTYVEEIFEHTEGKYLYWDEYSKIPFGRNNNQESPLKYILSQPPLQWAWYLLLAAVIIYFIFYAKRRQRIIPVLEENKNTTIQFAETMGYLYFEEQNHKRIADHAWQLFLSYIRNKYYIQVQKIDEETIKKISLKSQVSVQEIEAIAKHYDRLDFKVEISAEDLMAFHNQIELFYKNSK